MKVLFTLLLAASFLLSVSAFAGDETLPTASRQEFSNGFASLSIGARMETEGTDQTVEANVGLKVGLFVGELMDSKAAIVLGYDHSFRTMDYFGTQNDGLGDSIDVIGQATLNYYDLNFELLFMQIANSGFYFGPNFGLNILSVRDDTGTTLNNTTTRFEVGAEVGYEFFISKRFSVGPDVRYEHVFQSGFAGNLMKYSGAGTFHF